GGGAAGRVSSAWYSQCAPRDVDPLDRFGSLRVESGWHSNPNQRLPCQCHAALPCFLPLPFFSCPSSPRPVPRSPRVTSLRHPRPRSPPAAPSPTWTVRSRG